MAIETVARSTNQAINENILRRDIGDKIAELEPNDTALLVMTTNAKRKRATISPRVERIEDAVGREGGVRRRGCVFCRHAPQYSTGNGSSERHRYHVATVR